jgi:serine/threonine-protein kinase
MSEPPRFGKYEVVRLIGKGAMAAVYEALHPGLAKPVAIKVLLPSVAALPGARERFLREGRAAARIRHPHVVDVTDMGEDGPNGEAYLVMELLAGETFAEYLARRAPLPLERVTDLLLPVIAGVAAGHEEGVVHRDLKPQNVFLAQDRRGSRVPKVLDFGLSRLMDGSTTAEGLAPVGLRFGTAGYLAPEQVSGADADARADQYALGLILYEAATARPAHHGENAFALAQHILHVAPTPTRHLRPELPPTFEAVLTRALQKRPDDRFGSLYALGQALLPFASPKGTMRWGGTFAG